MCQTSQAGVTTERPPDDARPRREDPRWLVRLRRVLEILDTGGAAWPDESRRATTS